MPDDFNDTGEAVLVEARPIRVRTATFRLVFNKQGSWTHKWDNTNHLLMELNSLKEKQAQLSQWTVKTLYERAFLAFREVADWLSEDPAANIDGQDIVEFVRNDRDLKICDAFAQTCKHFRRQVTRKNSDPITAWISEVNETAARISWENESLTIVGECDALELANGISDSWWRFFSLKGLVTFLS